MTSEKRSEEAAPRRRRPVLKGLLACALALSLANAGYGAWAVYLRDRKIFVEIIYSRPYRPLIDGLYGKELSKKWAPEGFDGGDSKYKLQRENEEQERHLTYKVGDFKFGRIVISYKHGYLGYSLFATAEGKGGRTYFCSPRWR